MTDFYKVVDKDGFIEGFGTNGTNGPDGVTEIKENEYITLREMMHNRPTAPDGYTYALQDDPSEWVLVELPDEPEEPTVEDKAEAYDILTGVSD